MLAKKNLLSCLHGPPAVSEGSWAYLPWGGPWGRKHGRGEARGDADTAAGRPAGARTRPWALTWPAASLLAFLAPEMFKGWQGIWDHQQEIKVPSVLIWGPFCLRQDAWQCLKTFLAVTIGACHDLVGGARMHRTSPQHRAVWTTMCPAAALKKVRHMLQHRFFTPLFLSITKQQLGVG